MSERKPELLVEDMICACKNILDYTKNVDFQGFMNDGKTIDATVRNIEVLGEAASQIPIEYQKQYPEIEWTKIIRSRHIIVHHYFDLDYQIIWRIIQHYIPPLLKSLKKIRL